MCMIATKKKATRRKAVKLEDIIRSLGSEERRKVYWYLSDTYPEWTTVMDIARGVQSDYKNVMGALKGDGKRYSKKLALIKVYLVEFKAITFGGQKRYMYRARRRNTIPVIDNG